MEIKAKKSLGQNFLQDEKVLANIANSVATSEKDLIIEIGPGTGALTKYLVKKKSFLIAYEIDERLKGILNKFQNEKVKIIYGDFLKANILEDIKNIDYQNIYVIANIPYYITTPIIKKITYLEKLKSMTLLVQKEVALRFSAEPNSKAYGSLTVFLNYYFDIKYLFTVKNICFNPVPKVDSAVISLIRKNKNNTLKDEDIFFKLIEDAFKMKRKTLKNNLKSYDWDKILEVLKKYNLLENVRAEQVSLDVFIEIANSLT